AVHSSGTRFANFAMPRRGLMKIAKWILSWVISTAVALSVCYPLAYAAMSQEDYQRALKIAEQHVQRKKSRFASRANGLTGSATLLRNLYGRTYQVGDHWDVAVYQSEATQMRMTSESSKL